MALRLLLRVASLAAKFGLTIAVARALGFAAVGEYGLAVAVSVIASKLCGLGFSAELNRQLSGPTSKAAIETARGLRAVYVGFYLISGAGLLAASLGGWSTEYSASVATVGFVLLVAASEHYALEVNTYVFSVHRSRAGSSMLFARTGGWAAIAIVGLLIGLVKDIHTVFVLWIVSNVGVTFWAWMLLSRLASRHGEAAVRDVPLATQLRTTWTAGVHFYIGGVLLAGLQYAERFIATAWLPAAEVGRYVFMWSVANAVQTVAYATVGVIAGPRLARAAGATDVAWRETFRKSLRTTIGVSVTTAAGIACAAPIIFWTTKERTTPAALLTISILLASFMLRSIGDLLWWASVARRARQRIVLGMCVAASVALPISLWLIPGHGVVEVALAHLLGSVTVLVALFWAQRGGVVGEHDNV
ncbi:polysaccharide biosynthesis protein [Caballeronia cordobensis]|uniref:Polysaccharide biosynthesis protein n=1 Tax=Caballeronia cordobensis TaxID=1353886 RepID=A0A158JPL7_CABCO|nr:hypothetical protein [Caballeronia cordobensis]SAL70443.1 polysaccharide biosynthesis protein [Caballeronia cordobensis]